MAQKRIAKRRSWVSVTKAGSSDAFNEGGLCPKLLRLDAWGLVESLAHHLQTPYYVLVFCVIKQ